MFTKKIALFGLAGLTAFAISCSDSDDDETPVGGEFTTAFAASFDATSKKVVINAGIEANEDDAITGLKLTADGEPVEGITWPTLGATATITNMPISKVCKAAKAVTDKAISIVLTASFETGADLVSDAKSVLVPCSQDAVTEWASFTLSNAGTSYADLDGKTTYTKDDALTNKSKVDIFAFTGGTNGTNCASGSLCGIYIAGSAAGAGQLATGENESYVFALTEAAYPVLNSLSLGSQISEIDPQFLALLTSVTGVYDEDNGTGFPNAAAVQIKNDTWLLVNTSENAWCALKPSSVGTSTATFKAYCWK